MSEPASIKHKSNTALSKQAVKLQQGDALILVDLQNDFLLQGALAVPGGNQVIEPLNQLIEVFHKANLPIIATRDWHPLNHRSFQARLGPWPPHCVANTIGAQFADDLKLPSSIIIISKGIGADQEAYSGFEGTNLDHLLKAQHITRLVIGGLATEYCVFNTVRDAIRLGYQVFLIQDGIQAVNSSPGDGETAVKQMTETGAIPINSTELLSCNLI